MQHKSTKKQYSLENLLYSIVEIAIKLLFGGISATIWECFHVLFTDLTFASGKSQ